METKNILKKLYVQKNVLNMNKSESRSPIEITTLSQNEWRAI